MLKKSGSRYRLVLLFSSPAVSPRAVSDDQSSVTDEFESSFDDSFEFTAVEAAASVEIVQHREVL